MRAAREAAIAIGSNSIRMLSAQLDGELSRPLRLREETGLVLMLDGDGCLRPDALRRLLEAVERLAKAARADGARRVHLYATSALREAGNAAAFQALLEERLPELRLRIITGEEEARLSFLGASLPPFAGPRGLMDIGGGSTEIALGDENGPSLLYSLKLGAGRLLAACPIQGPEDLALAERMVQELLKRELPSIDVRQTPFLLVGGTGTALLGIARGIPHGAPQPEQGELALDEVAGWLSRLAGLSEAGRALLTGMPPGRERILPTGLAILLALMRWLALPSITVTGRGNLDGFLVERAAFLLKNAGAGSMTDEGGRA